MEQKIGTVIDLVKRSVKGNFTAQELLHLKEGVPYDSPTMFNPEQSPDKLIDDMCDLAYFAAASNKLQLNHCEQMARVGLCLLCSICVQLLARQDSEEGQHL